MRKLDRLCKQIGNIEDVDGRFIKGLERVTTSTLQDAKFEMVAHRAELDGRKLGSSRSSPYSSPYSSFPSTPQKSSTPERSGSPTVNQAQTRFKSAVVITPPESTKPTLLPTPSKPSLPVSTSKVKKTKNPPAGNPFKSVQNPPAGNPFESAQSTNPFGEDEDENDNYDPSLNPFADEPANQSTEKGSIAMSDRVGTLFQPQKSDREIQIDFLIKDIHKARSKGDTDKADMIQNVLDQILQESST